MKVLLVSHEFPPIGGGAGNAARHLSGCLGARGVDVTVLTSGFRNTPKDESVDGVRVIRVPAFRNEASQSTSLSLVAYAGNALFRSLRMDRPDVVHTFFGVPGGGVGYALKQALGTPYIISFRGKDVHGGKSESTGGISGGLKWVSRPVWRAADALIANSEGLADVARHVDTTVSVETIPNGVDTDRFSPAENQNRSPVTILFVGRLEPYKGLSTLLRAASVIKERASRPFEVRIVGDGSLRSTLESEAQQLGLNRDVSFEGWIDAHDIPQVYKEAEIFVLPSVVEGMPNGVLEAMASGLPTIASRVPGTEDLIEDGKNGLLCTPEDVGALTEALEMMVGNDVLRRQAGIAARRSAHSRSWDSVAEAYLQVYERVLTDNGFAGSEERS